jgi:hypothetical protein
VWRRCGERSRPPICVIVRSVFNSLRSFAGGAPAHGWMLHCMPSRYIPCVACVQSRCARACLPVSPRAEPLRPYSGLRRGAAGRTVGPYLVRTVLIWYRNQTRVIAARLDSNWTGGVAVASQKCAKARASLAPSIPVLLRITLIKVSAIWYCNRLRTTVRRFISQRRG